MVLAKCKSWREIHNQFFVTIPYWAVVKQGFWVLGKVAGLPSIGETIRTGEKRFQFQ